MKPLCIYHNADLDGICSAAIVNKAYSGEVDLHGYNYGDPVPWELIKNRPVILVDCSLDFGTGEMTRLVDESSSVTWIDHHHTAIEEAENQGLLEKMHGLQVVGTAACILTWKHFFGTDAPEAVRYLGAYDIWDHSDPNTLPFQYGARLTVSSPENLLWLTLLGPEDIMHRRVVDGLLFDGKVCLQYQQSQNKKACQSLAFETELDDYSIIAANALGYTSSFFDSSDTQRYDLMLLFGWAASVGQWRVSIYTTKDDIDCGIIAKAHGGGGHKQAAGFQCAELPFKLMPQTWVQRLADLK